MPHATPWRTRAARPRGGGRIWLLAAMVAIAAGCTRHDPAAERAAATAAAQPAPVEPAQRPAVSSRDLSIDESMGGHTLARHVGKSDAELAERLRREPQIAAASTYTDRATAERAVAAALDSSRGQLASWSTREGRRPNLVLRYARGNGPLGRSLTRGARAAVPCRRAIVVLRWDERRNRFYVLTSYPEADR